MALKKVQIEYIDDDDDDDCSSSESGNDSDVDEEFKVGCAKHRRGSSSRLASATPTPTL